LKAQQRTDVDMPTHVVVDQHLPERNCLQDDGVTHFSRDELEVEADCGELHGTLARVRRGAIGGGPPWQ